MRVLSVGWGGGRATSHPWRRAIRWQWRVSAEASTATSATAVSCRGARAAAVLGPRAVGGSAGRRRLSAWPMGSQVDRLSLTAPPFPCCHIPLIWLVPPVSAELPLCMARTAAPHASNTRRRSLSSSCVCSAERRCGRNGMVELAGTALLTPCWGQFMCR